MVSRLQKMLVYVIYLSIPSHICFLLQLMLLANNFIHPSKIQSLDFARNPTSDNVLTWLQRVCFSYVYLCLFDDIRSAILHMLPLKSEADSVFDPINLHKCVIIPCNAIGTYYSILRIEKNLNAESQQTFGRFCRQQSALAIMYTNKYIVKYFKFLSGINKKMLASFEKRESYHHLLKPPSQNQTTTVMFFKNCAPKLLLSRKSILVSSQAEFDAEKLIHQKKTIEILLKQRLNFYLNN